VEPSPLEEFSFIDEVPSLLKGLLALPYSVHPKAFSLSCWLGYLTTRMFWTLSPSYGRLAVKQAPSSFFAAFCSFRFLTPGFEVITTVSHDFFFWLRPSFGLAPCLPYCLDVIILVDFSPFQVPLLRVLPGSSALTVCFLLV